MERRQLIKISLALSAFTLANRVCPAWALPASSANLEQFFIYIHIHDGWDISLGPDPFLGNVRPDPRTYFVEYTQDQLIKSGDRFFAPAMAPLKPHFPRLAVINGVFMNANDIGHDGLTSYVSSGGNGKSSASTDIYSALSPDLLGILSNSLRFPSSEIASIVQLDSLNDLSGGSLVDPQTIARVAVNKNDNIEKAFNKIGGPQTARFSSFVPRYEKIRQNTQNDDWARLVAAFSAGLSSAAQISINEGGIDSHSGHERNHLTALTRAFDRISDLLNLLSKTKHNSGDSMLNRTTIVVSSEFSRTPGLNAVRNGGKDHNPTTNSMIVLGPGINGVNVGASRLIAPKDATSYLAAIPISTETEQPVTSSQGTKLIRPAMVWNTVMTSMGIPQTNIPSTFANAKLLKTILKA